MRWHAAMLATRTTCLAQSSALPLVPGSSGLPSLPRTQGCGSATATSTAVADAQAQVGRPSSAVCLCHLHVFLSLHWRPLSDEQNLLLCRPLQPRLRTPPAPAPRRKPPPAPLPSGAPHVPPTVSCALPGGGGGGLAWKGWLYTHNCLAELDPAAKFTLYVASACSRNIAVASVTVEATACAENGGNATATASGQAEATAVAEAATQTYAAALAALQQCPQAKPSTGGPAPAPAPAPGRPPGPAPAPAPAPAPGPAPANLQCIILQVRGAPYDGLTSSPLRVGGGPPAAPPLALQG